MEASLLVCVSALVVMASTATQHPMPSHPADPRLIANPVTEILGIPISNDTSTSKSVNSIAPTVPVAGVTFLESKPREWLSSTPTVAERSRCLEDYRKKSDAPPPVVRVDIAYPHQYPFMVTIGHFCNVIKEYELLCSGSLISPTKILTSASCITNSETSTPYPVKHIRVKLGMNFLNKKANDAQLSRNVKKIEVHGQYHNNSLNDLVIVTMDSPVEYSDKISPVCLVPDCFDDNSGQSVIAMGWQYPPYRGKKNSDFLGVIRLSILPIAKCQTEYRSHVSDNQVFCAKQEGDDFCARYLGGPLVIENNSRSDTSCRFMQVGVFGNHGGCAKGDTHSFVRVKKYLTWIEETSK